MKNNVRLNCAILLAVCSVPGAGQGNPAAAGAESLLNRLRPGSVKPRSFKTTSPAVEKRISEKAPGPPAECTPAAVTPEVTVEIVNSSAVPDDKVQLLLRGGDVPEVTGIAVYYPCGDTAAKRGVPLSSLTKLPTVVTSPFTGTTLPVYSFGVQELDSGRLYVAYSNTTDGSAFQYTFQGGGDLPTAFENYRYDKVELSYPADKSGGGNLTSIDFFGIPMQVEVFHGTATDPDPLQTKSYYASTSTLLKALAGLSPGMASGAGWTLGQNGTTIDPATSAAANGLAKFLRILSPNTIAPADKPQGRPFPYPSFDLYLSSLVGKSFKLRGVNLASSPPSGEIYKYKATVGTANGGYEIVLEKDVPDGTLGQYPFPTKLQTQYTGDLPMDAKVTMHLPIGQPSSQAGASAGDPVSLDYFIYACVPNQNSYSIDGYPWITDQDKKDNLSPLDQLNRINQRVDYVNGTMYAALMRDVCAALNFGFLDSSYVNPGDDMTSMHKDVAIPYPYPYGGARRQNDGFYNSYAATFYYLSDSYGHPFSDWLGAASPLYQFTRGDRVRITILPDNRLDTPLVTVADKGADSLSLSFKTIPGATSYGISVNPGVTNLQQTCTPQNDMQNCIIKGLAACTSYLVSVKALGPNSTASNQLPVQGVTQGTCMSLQGPISFQANIAVPPGLDAKIDNKAVVQTQSATINASPGLNLMGLAVYKANQIVYQGTYLLNLSDLSDQTGKFFGIGTPYQLLNNLTPLEPRAPMAKYPFTGNPLAVTTTLTPKPYNVFYGTVIPAISDAFNAANPAGGGFAPGTYASIKSPVNQFGSTDAPFLFDPYAKAMPKQVSGLHVLVNNVEAPIQYMSQTQINFIIPYATPVTGKVDVVLQRISTGEEVVRRSIAMNATAPSLFTATGSGSGQLWAFNLDAILGAASADGMGLLNLINSAGSPVSRGSQLILFGTGLGAVPGASADGVRDEDTPTSTQTGVTTVLIDGKPAKVTYSGLAAGAVAIWEILVEVPATVTPGASVPIRATLNGIASDRGTATTISVK